MDCTSPLVTEHVLVIAESTSGRSKAEQNYGHVVEHDRILNSAAVFGHTDFCAPGQLEHALIIEVNRSPEIIDVMYLID